MMEYESYKQFSEFDFTENHFVEVNCLLWDHRYRDKKSFKTKICWIILYQFG